MASQHDEEAARSSTACYHDRPLEDVKDRKDSMLNMEKPDISIDALDDVEANAEEATTPEPFDVDTSMEDSMLSHGTEFEVEETSEDAIAMTPKSFEVDTSMEDSTLIYDTSADYNTASPIADSATEEIEEGPQELFVTTAAQKVFATNALIERILLNLPDIKADKTVKKIFVAQRINKTVQTVVRRSFKIRRVMVGRKERIMRGRREVERMGSRAFR